MSIKTTLKCVSIFSAIMAAISIYFDFNWMGAYFILLYIYQMYLYNTTKD